MGIKSPFFIVGCVRSGTTMLRKILNNHPNLESPEETHVFRWADPYGSNRWNNIYAGKLLQRHSEIDGFDSSEVDVIREKACCRKEYLDLYMKKFLEKKGNLSARWFDKTPQNIYGIHMLKYYYPKSKFIHLARNPLNVASSLITGDVMPKHALIGAVNYVNESMIMLESFTMANSHDVIDIRYEDFCSNPKLHVNKILEFIDEEEIDFSPFVKNVHVEKNKYLDVLNKEQIDFVKSKCMNFIDKYGYR